MAELLSQRRGHFVLESGHHGELWLELELLFLHPERVEPLAAALARRLAPYEASFVCAPLVEGAFVGLRVAAALGLPFAYTEPAAVAAGDGLFPVDYALPTVLRPRLANEAVLVVNDVVNAGSAVRGTLKALLAAGARPRAIGTLAVLGERAAELASASKVGLEALASFPNRIWQPGSCELCARGIPLVERAKVRLPSQKRGSPPR